MTGRRGEMTVDHMFALFRTSGRPHWLAEVFDRTAPELLRVAIHATRDPDQAEDLVQSCFVEAIRTARAFDPERRVLPWLLGILGNLAREARRRDRRQPDPTRLAFRAEKRPDESATEGELNRAVDDAIQDLPPQYRPVLVLHLRHGLGPAEIGHALGRGPGTVRSQLARGLTQLRRLLPAGFAGALALAITPTRGLAAIRRAVVLRAALAGPGLLLASVGEWMVSMRVALLAVAAAALVIWQGVDWGSPNPGPATVATVVSSQRSQEDASAAPASLPNDRIRAATTVEPTPGRLEIQVRDAHGLPLAGVGIRVMPTARNDVLLAERRSHTNAAGTAVLDEVPAGPLTIELDRAPGPRITLEPGERRVLQIDLDPGHHVQGIVVDVAGEPIADAAVWLADGGRADGGMVVTRSDAGGRFSIADVQAGYHIAAFATDHPPCRSVPVEEAADHTLRLERGATQVRGRVTGTDGRPLPGARVRIGFEAQPFWFVDGGRQDLRVMTNQIPICLITDAHGWFETRAAAPGADVDIYCRALGHTGQHRSLALEADRSVTLHFELDRGGAVCGQVHDGEQPVAGAYVWSGAGQLGAPGWFAPLSRTDADGRYRLDGVPIGPGRVQVIERGGGPVTANVDVRVDSVTRLDVALHRAPRISGSVQDAAGRPRAGMNVRLVPGHRETRTDAMGRFRFLVDPVRTYHLTVHDPRCRAGTAIEHLTGLRSGPELLTITVAEERLASARLTGRVLTKDGSLPEHARVLLRADEGLWTTVDVESATGFFDVTPLVPGEYQVRIEADGHPHLMLDRQVLENGQETDLGVLSLAPGGHLALRVVRAGELLDESVNVLIQTAAGEELYRRDLVDADHSIRWLPVGRHLATIWSTTVPIVSEFVDVVADQKTRVVLAVDGARRQSVIVHGIEPELELELVSLRALWLDEEGREIAASNHLVPSRPVLQLDQVLMPGNYTVVILSESGRSGRTPFTVTAGSDPAPVTVTLAR